MWEPSRGTVPRLKTEDVLDFVPEREHEHQGERDQDDHRDEEAQARTRALSAPFGPRAPLRSIQAVSVLDRRWIDRRFLGRGDSSACRLGHPAILVAEWP